MCVECEGLNKRMRYLIKLKNMNLLGFFLQSYLFVIKLAGFKCGVAGQLDKTGKRVVFGVITNTVLVTVLST